jgi:hypothetical protein
MSRGGSLVMVTRVGQAACAGGRARQRRVLRPAHGGRAQSNHSGSFTGGQRWCRSKESKSGSPCSSVYMRWRSDEVRRRQSGTSSDVVLGLKARGASLSSEEAIRGIWRGGGGPEWPVHGGRGSGSRRHAVRRANSGDLALGRGWERVRAHGQGLGRFYRRGHGCRVGRRVARARGAEHQGVLWHCQGRSNTCSFLSARVLALAEQPNVWISPYELCKISSLHLGLPSLCQFQVKIWSSLGDMVAPSQGCRHCSTWDKTCVKPCKTVLVWFQNFQGCALGNLAPFCQ